jgi:hypothetical protein
LISQSRGLGDVYKRQPFIRYASLPVMFVTVKHPSKPPSLNDSGLRSIQKFIIVSSWNENILDTVLGWLTPNLGTSARIRTLNNGFGDRCDTFSPH